MGTEKYRRAVCNLQPFKPAKNIEKIQEETGLSNILRLAANENALGTSHKVLEAISKVLKNVYLYPDGMCTKLRKKLSLMYGIKKDQLVFGNGSFELINLISEIFINPGDEVIIPYPTFGWYKVAALKMDGIPVEVPLKEYLINLSAMKKKISNRTKIIWICNPNNPTGTYINQKALTDFFESIPSNIVIVMDEAYYEFAQNDDYPETTEFVNKYRNIIVLRTFSKAYGLAGLRIGYGIANKNTVEMLNKIRIPINVNILAQAAAEASLDDEKFLKKCISNNNSGKEYFYKKFKELNLEYIPTATNFVMVNINQNSTAVTDEISRYGIVVRSGEEFNMPTWLRITIGKPEENKLLIDRLIKILKR